MEPVSGSVSFFAEAALPARIPLTSIVLAGVMLLAFADHAPARQSAQKGQPLARRRAPFRVPSENEITDTVFRASAMRGARAERWRD